MLNTPGTASHLSRSENNDLQLLCLKAKVLQLQLGNTWGTWHVGNVASLQQCVLSYKIGLYIDFFILLLVCMSVIPS